MEKSKRYEQVKAWYDKGYWTDEMVRNAVAKDWITETEYSEITGRAYA